MDPNEVADPSPDVTLPPLVQNSSTDTCSPDESPEVPESTTNEVKDGRKEGKTFPKESIVNVTVDKSNPESIDIMTRFIDMGLSNGGYDSCMGYDNKTKYMQRIVNEEFKYDGIFNEYKQPSYGKFTKGIYNGLKQLEELVSHSHASADAEHGEQYPASIRDLVTKYMKFVKSRELSTVAVSQAAKNSSIQADVISVTPAIGPTDVQAIPRSSVAKANEQLGYRVVNQDRSGIAYDNEGSATKRSKKAKTETTETKNSLQVIYETSVVNLELDKGRTELRTKQLELKKAFMSEQVEAKKISDEMKMNTKLKMKLYELNMQLKMKLYELNMQEQMKLQELNMQLKMKQEELRLRGLNELINYYKELRGETNDQEKKDMYEKKIADLNEKKLQLLFKIEKVCTV